MRRSLKLYGFFDRNEPRISMLIKANANIYIVPLYFVESGAVDYLDNQISEECRNDYYIDIFNNDDYKTVKQRFDKHMQGCELMLKIMD